MTQFPIFMGGDKTINPFLSVDNNPVTKPANAAITMMTGENNSAETRQVVSWLNSMSVSIQSQVYDSLYSVIPSYFNPWSTDVSVTGTDGLQVAPDIDEEGAIKIFSSDLSRPISFLYTSESESTFPGYETLLWEMDPADFSVATNSQYMVYVDGTTNLTTTFQAPVFASMGNFFGISEDAQVLQSMPLNSQGQPIIGDATKGASWYVTEELSG